MTNKQLAIEFLDGFSAGDLVKIRSLLSDGFEFNGPFLTASTAADYLKALESDPPERSSYRILSMFENQDEVCFIYRFEKEGVVASLLVERGLLLEFWKSGDGSSTK